MHYKNAPKSLTIILALSMPIIINLAIWNLWPHEEFAATAIILTILGATWYFRSLKMLIIAIIVGTLGTLQDTYFITQNLWHYSSLQDNTIPLYIPPLWAAVACMIIGVFKVIQKVTRDHNILAYHRPRSGATQLITTALTLILALFALAHLSQNTPILAATFLVINIGYIWFMRSAPMALVGIVVFFVAMLSEITAVAMGAWHYPSGTFYGVPPYIFFGWDVVGTLIVGTYTGLDALIPEIKNYLTKCKIKIAT